MSGATPTLEQVIRMAIEARLLDVHVSMPGIIESYDPGTQTATIQPSLKRKYEDGVVVALPLINKVPVVFPRGDGWQITGPLKKGNPVTIVFSERSLEVWKKKGGVVDPADPRKFHISDAIAIPGGAAEPDKMTIANPAALQLQIGQALIEATKGGKFKIKGASEELITLLSELLQELSITQTPVGPLLNAANFTALKTRLDTLKG